MVSSVQIFSRNFQQLPSKSNMPLQLKLTNAALSVLVKLQKLKILDPAKKIVESVCALFDPRNAGKNMSAAELVAMQKNVPSLERVHSQQFLEGHTIFLDAVKEQLRKEDCVSVDVTEILSGLNCLTRNMQQLQLYVSGFLVSTQTLRELSQSTDWWSVTGGGNCQQLMQRL